MPPDSVRNSKLAAFSISHAACHGPARHETICKWTGFDGCNPFAIPLEHGRLADSLPFVLPLRAPARGNLLFPLQHPRRPVLCHNRPIRFCYYNAELEIIPPLLSHLYPFVGKIGPAVSSSQGICAIIKRKPALPGRPAALKSGGHVSRPANSRNQTGQCPVNFIRNGAHYETGAYLSAGGSHPQGRKQH